MESEYLGNFQPLDVVCEVKLAKEIDESTSVVVDFVMASLTVEQKTQKNVSWRYEDDRAAADANVLNASTKRQRT